MSDQIPQNDEKYAKWLEQINNNHPLNFVKLYFNPNPANYEMIKHLSKHSGLPFSLLNLIIEFLHYTKERLSLLDELVNLFRDKKITTIQEGITELEKIRQQSIQENNSIFACLLLSNNNLFPTEPIPFISEKTISKHYKFEGKVMESLLSKINSEINFKLNRLKSCESPIEQLLYLELEESFMYWDIFNGLKVSLLPQYNILLNGNKYRVDIMLQVEQMGTEGDNLPPLCKIAIECDGHEFHEKTKEQAQRDKERDRAFLSVGIPVARFTGSEIWNNVQKCCFQVEAILKTQLEKLHGTHYFISVPKSD